MAERPAGRALVAVAILAAAVPGRPPDEERPRVSSPPARRCTVKESRPHAIARSRPRKAARRGPARVSDGGARPAARIVKEVRAAWLSGLTAAAFAARIAEPTGVRYDPDECSRLILRLGLLDHLKYRR
jgi:hypothetical protein